MSRANITAVADKSNSAYIVRPFTWNRRLCVAIPPELQRKYSILEEVTELVLVAEGNELRIRVQTKGEIWQ